LTKRREWIAEFGSLYQSQRPEKAALEATKRRADTVRAALGQTTGQPFLLSARERSELERGRKEALETASRYRSARLNVARLVERARSSPLLPGGLLEEELRRIEAAR
jgi:nitroimidazol reductase NimA-like FMN-containing flavoprotein (pyridoxamine 5'-phosphate oxidase superfamily)